MMLQLSSVWCLFSTWSVCWTAVVCLWWWKCSSCCIWWADALKCWLWAKKNKSVWLPDCSPLPKWARSLLCYVCSAKRRLSPLQSWGGESRNLSLVNCCTENSEHSGTYEERIHQVNVSALRHSVVPVGYRTEARLPINFAVLTLGT